MKIGIFGLGVVGNSVKLAFEAAQIDVVSYDPKFDLQYDGAKFLTCQFIFVCVPTPTTDGKQDQTAIYDVCRKLTALKYHGAVVIKSTVLPETCDKLTQTFPLLFIHNPEFLTERNARQDFLKQTDILYSIPKGYSAIQQEFETIHRKALPASSALKFHDFNDYKITEMAKYLHNCFLATKVVFANEMYRLCATSDIDFKQVVKAAQTQGKIGESHWQVPGPDGKMGYGGMCFPKDMDALANYAVQKHCVQMVLTSALITNKQIRQD